MAKKKPAAKLQKKKPVQSAGKKSPKKVVKMAKKAPAKKAPAKKVAAKKSGKSLVQKVVAKVKSMTKEQLKALKAKEKAAAEKEKARLAKEKQKEKAALEKEKAREKALLAKEKEKEAKEKNKQKEIEKKQKEQAKIQAKQAKEQEKLDAKKRKEDEKQRLKDEKERAKRIARGEDVEDEAPRRPVDGDDEDEFLEYAKKSKKSGKSKYDEVVVDAFEGKSKKYKNALMNDLESKIGDEIAELREHFNWKDIAEAIGTMDFFIDAKNDECVEKGCDNIRTTQSYCRLHYLRNWKVIQKKREILKEGKLQEYIEELISKYPPKYIEALLSDLSDDKDFYTVLNQLNITSEFDFEEDELISADDDDDDGDDIGIETISSSLRYEDE